MEIKFNNLKKQMDVVRPVTLEKINKLFDQSDYILGGEVNRFEWDWRRFVGTDYAIGVSSGTSAITLCIDALVRSDKKTLIITQNNTYIATLFGIINGLRSDLYHIHICDCDGFGQLNLVQLEEYLEKNRHLYVDCIIVPVHMYGGCVDAMTLQDLKLKYNFRILEDSAQAHGTISNLDTMTGSIGDLAAFSFYPGKNLGACGDAGAITTNSKYLYEHIINLRNLGGKTKYKHKYLGYNSRLDTIQAIILREKLKYLKQWNIARNNIAQIYQQELKINIKPSYCHYHTYHLFPYYTTRYNQLLDSKKIQYGRHYPETIFDIVSKYNWNINISFSLLVSSQNQKNHVTLPIHPFMTDDEVYQVCYQIKEI